MKIKIIVVGKPKNPALLQLTQEYLQKLKPMVQIRIQEVRDFPVRKGFSLEVAANQETPFIQEHISDPFFYFVLDERGKQKATEEWAELFQRFENESRKEITFVIGGPYGLSEEIKRGAKERFALSKLTFTHEMARVILLEQIYRVYTILRKIPYHHAG